MKLRTWRIALWAVVTVWTTFVLGIIILVIRALIKLGS